MHAFTKHRSIDGEFQQYEILCAIRIGKRNQAIAGKRESETARCLRGRQTSNIPLQNWSKSRQLARVDGVYTGFDKVLVAPNLIQQNQLFNHHGISHASALLGNSLFNRLERRGGI
jgi:hypothetical protein